MNGKIKTALIAALAVGGMLLVLFGGSFGKTDEKTEAPSEDGYVATLESELLILCSSVRGVSKCDIAVTLERGFEYGYDSRGNVVTVKYPRVCGVAVVCGGGDVPQIKKELTDLISSLLGISSNQIAVSGK